MGEICFFHYKNIMFLSIIEGKKRKKREKKKAAWKPKPSKWTSKI